jgi:hypothetical protein
MVTASIVQKSVLAASSLLEKQTIDRVLRLCHRAVREFDLDLSGLRVLTEAATGPYAVTPILAALAGAEQVIAVTRDSVWGTALTAIAQVELLARKANLTSIQFEMRPAWEVASGCDLVTNLGFVRPIGSRLLSALAPNAVVSLMWEPWEFRVEDIDTVALEACDVALIGTNEMHPSVRTFEYLGVTAARLLLEIGVEVVNSQLVVVGSEPFGNAIRTWFERAGSNVFSLTEFLSDRTRDVDALIYAEHRLPTTLFEGSQAGQAIGRLSQCGAPIIRICGNLDVDALCAAGIQIVPSVDVPPGVMAVTTGYAGPRPVIDLHAAGLRAGSDVVRARRNGLSIAEAVVIAQSNGFGAAVKLNTPEAL